MKTKKKQRKKRIAPESAYARLKALPIFQELHKKLCAGVSCESAAAWIQDTYGLESGVKRETLVRQLYRYRDTIPLADRTPRSVVKLYEKVEKFSHEVNTLEELTKLYEYQLMRLNKAIEMEEQTNIPFPGTARELDRAVDYVLRIANLKMQMGLLDKVKGEQRGRREEDGQGPIPSGILGILVARYGPDVENQLALIGKRLQASFMSSVTHQLPARLASPDEDAEIVSVEKPPVVEKKKPTKAEVIQALQSDNGKKRKPKPKE